MDGSRAGITADHLGDVRTLFPVHLPRRPHVERLRGNKSLSAALTGITAAVVGVIANLAVYFATHTLFATTTAWNWGPVHLDLPEASSLQPGALLLTIGRNRHDLPAAMERPAHPRRLRRRRARPRTSNLKPGNH